MGADSLLNKSQAIGMYRCPPNVPAIGFQKGVFVDVTDQKHQVRDFNSLTGLQNASSGKNCKGYTLQ